VPGGPGEAQVGLGAFAAERRRADQAEARYKKARDALRELCEAVEGMSVFGEMKGGKTRLAATWKSARSALQAGDDGREG
jgi:hypothetical protein